MVRNIKDKTPNQDTIRLLESLLRDAKNGEVRTIVAIAGFDDDSWTNSWSLDERNTNRRMIGELAMLQHDLITHQSLADGDTVLCRALDE